MRIKFYATLRAIVGERELDLPLAEDATVRDLATLLVTRWPEMSEVVFDEHGELSRRVHVMIDGRSSRHLPEGSDTLLRNADQVDVFPAVAGGSGK